MFYVNYIKYCKRKGISASAAAAEMGFNKSSVSGWKNKGSVPTDTNLQRIADYFGITVAELLGEEKKTATNGDDLEWSEETLKLAKWFEEADENTKALVMRMAGMG